MQTEWRPPQGSSAGPPLSADCEALSVAAAGRLAAPVLPPRRAWPKLLLEEYVRDHKWRSRRDVLHLLCGGLLLLLLPPSPFLLAMGELGKQGGDDDDDEARRRPPLAEIAAGSESSDLEVWFRLRAPTSTSGPRFEFELRL